MYDLFTYIGAGWFQKIIGILLYMDGLWWGVSLIDFQSQGFNLPWDHFALGFCWRIQSGKHRRQHQLDKARKSHPGYPGLYIYGNSHFYDLPFYFVNIYIQRCQLLRRWQLLQLLRSWIYTTLMTFPTSTTSTTFQFIRYVQRWQCCVCFKGCSI